MLKKWGKQDKGMEKIKMEGYEYLGKNGDFILKNPEKTSYLYFPLANESSVMSSVTPNLSGDSKLNQNSFFMPPVSAENLHNDKSSRNIWCKVDGNGLCSLTGKSSFQQAELFSSKKEETELEAGLMHHTVRRKIAQYDLQAEIRSLVPASDDLVELLHVKVINTGNLERSIELITVIPFYGRSADNIRDHRHVTSLLNRIYTEEYGIVVNPTMSFDERGHQLNSQMYGVYGLLQGMKPIGYYPLVETFIGEGGSLENPGALQDESLKLESSGMQFNGYEALGGLCFEEKKVGPSECISCIVALVYGNDRKTMKLAADKYLNEDSFEKAWKDTKEYWQNKVNVSYETGSLRFDNWMIWVSFQPILRKIYGCSFLPHHDYGKGGRGWRDLWQDCLALIIMNPDGVRQMLIDNLAGVRMDGTNATIIGKNQGEFIADRNNITRVWMDHGIWPLLTIDLYIHQTGDIHILMEKNSYFKDMQVSRGEKKDLLWKPEDGERQKDIQKNVYTGTVLEHILLQNISSFWDVGEHNHIRIRGADWNDALDMAEERGESVAFTNMYAKNLVTMADLLSWLKDTGIAEIELAEEMAILLNDNAELYDNILDKQKVLHEYCKTCGHEISGRKISISTLELRENLLEKAEWIKNHIRKTEWIQDQENCGFYNGYYDNHGRKVEGIYSDNVRMMLTSQVFSIMSGTATLEQVDQIINASDKYLYKESVGGYRLNTDFKEIKMDMGRMFGFAYGHKENGSVFSHMAVMYANALYSRRKAAAAFKVIDSLFKHCDDFKQSKIYPGIPEYIDVNGRGMYHYLTGSASWLLLTVITKMFGISSEKGNLVFCPQLLLQQFDAEGCAVIKLQFASVKLCIHYENKLGLEYDQYRVSEIYLDGVPYAFTEQKLEIRRSCLQAMSKEKEHEIRVILI